MKCSGCGYDLPTKDAEKLGKICPSCGRKLSVSAVELLSNPQLGFVTDIRPGQIELTKVIDELFNAVGHKKAMCEGGCGIGKAQPLDAKILCPDRWRYMGGMEVGVPLLGRDGRTYTVTGVFPQGVKDVFRVTFTDGSVTTCCAEHLWLVQNKKDRARRRPGSIRSLLDLMTEGLKHGREHRHWTPIMASAEFSRGTALPLDPYVLGVILGDGGLTSSSAVSITKTDTDVFIIDELRRLIPPEDQIKGCADSTYHITSRTTGRWDRSRTTDILIGLGLWGRLSVEKFIPEAYLWATLGDRLRLLQGLCDTDECNLTANVEYSSSARRLAEGVRFLVQSLGGTTSFNSRTPTYVYKGERRKGYENHRLVFTLPPTIVPFKLPRKCDAYHTPTKYFPRRAITKVERLGKQETQCIATSAPDQLYITDDFIVTHNTFAYGVPAVLTRKRTVISTGKKALQDQLGKKDLAFLQAHLGVPHEYVSLKGKSNYLCARLLRKRRKLFAKHHQERLWEKLTKWVDANPVGDLDTFPGKLDYPATLCTAADCSCGKRSTNCGHAMQKAFARKADVIVINHSLLGFDLRLGTGRIFGPYSHLIIDEAHASPDFIRRAFAEELTPTWMRNTYNKLVREQIEYQSNRDEQEVYWQQLFKGLPEEQLLGFKFLDPAKLKDAVHALDVLEEDLKEVIYRRWHPIKGSAKKAVVLSELLLSVEDDLYHAGNDEDWDDFSLLGRIFEDLDKKRSALTATQNPEDNWVNCREEMRDGQCKIVRQPVNLAPLVKGPLGQIDKVLFTSATLNFDALKSEFGIVPDYEVTVPSPFPYQKSLVYLPKHLPRPTDPKWHFAAAKEIVQLVRASKGNALVLFSSMRDLRAIHECIQVNWDLEHAIFAQGDGRRPMEVFQEFMNTNNSVLFGSKSFFEGIDVQGAKLRLVIVAKIPFPPKEDPLNKAKEQLMGGQVFWNRYYFPNMLQDIQQAFGRLVRTKDDRGVVALLDVRIWVGGNKSLDPRDVGTQRTPWKGYGHRIIKALPFPNFTPRLTLVLQYFEHMLRSD